MRAIFEHPFVQWLILILAVMAGFLAIKYLTSYLPNSGPAGAIKAAIQAA